MAWLHSLNVGRVIRNPWDEVPLTGIDKRPVEGPVEVADPGPPGQHGGAGLAGDAICDTRHHGGHDQALYAYAREDLDAWERELGRELRCGMFGENFTTLGLDVSGARIGERWRVGASCILEVTSPRIPCRTFAGWLQEQRWQRRFTEHGAPGAYLRVLSPGTVRSGDPIEVVHRPGHDISVAFTFRALTTRKRLIPSLAAAADALPPDVVQRIVEATARLAEAAPQ